MKTVFLDNVMHVRALCAIFSRRGTSTYTRVRRRGDKGDGERCASISLLLR